VSLEDFRRLQPSGGNFWEAYERWRSSVDLEELNFDVDAFLEGIRDKSPGRDVDL
jgi:hypothetical protein